jgi:serine/threonine protein phosphatase 1
LGQVARVNPALRRDGQVMVFRLLRPRAKAARAASTGGPVVYAIGDVHGQLELLDQLLEIIVRDFHALKRGDRPVLVFVGDYVDRGPMSKGVIDRLIELGAMAARDGFQVRTLMGNHEQTMLSFLENPEAGPAWVEFGGGETLTSYGVNRPASRAEPEVWQEVQVALQRNLPSEHVAFLRGLELSAIYGDYLFVHAGVRPGVPLDRQNPEDLLWIRGDFLSQPHRLDYVVVHGHTPDEEPFIGPARINVDTGAYATGVLTAVRLDGGAPTILQARKSRRT